MKRLRRFLHNVRACLLRPATTEEYFVGADGQLYRERYVTGFDAHPITRPVAGFSAQGNLLMQQ